MAVHKQKEQKQGRRREQILHEAAKVFAKKGYHATTVEEIARELGVTKASIYYYVSDKSDLLYQLYKRAMELLLAMQAEIMATTGTADEKLRSIIANHVHVVGGYHALFSVVILREHHALPPQKRKEIIALRDQYEGCIRNLIAEGIETGAFEPVDVKMATHAILGALNWIPTWYNPRGERSKEEVGSIYAHYLVKGLKKHGE